MSEDTPVIILFKSAHPALYTDHRRYPGSQLGPGFLAAHRMTHLVLLHSCPDTVHEVLLRKTQTSTPLTRGSPARSHPRRDITSAGADCRYRAPLSPRLRGSFLTCSCAHLRFIANACLVYPRKRGFVKAGRNFPVPFPKT